MEISNMLAQIIQRLNQWLSDPSLVVTEENTLFVRDSAVEYPANGRGRCYSVRREDLVTAEQFSWAFEEMLLGGPDWIHANLVSFSNDQFLITLCTGRKVGATQPSINVSYEPDKTAEILTTKTLVTTS